MSEPYTFPGEVFLSVTPELQRKGHNSHQGHCAIAEAMREVAQWKDAKFFSVDRDGACLTKGGQRATYELDNKGLRLLLANDDAPKYRAGRKLRTVRVRLSLARVRPKNKPTRTLSSYEEQKKSNVRGTPKPVTKCFLKRRVNGKVRHVPIEPTAA